jgi:TM2 domain-containing membrane protein YozV
MNNNVSEKSRLGTFILALVFGGVGLHRFYVGKYGTGILIIILSLLSVFTISYIWVAIDCLVILLGGFRDKENKKIINWFT